MWFNSNMILITGCTAERVFRVDSGQEHLHYITDIATDCLYILDPISSLDTDVVGYNKDQLFFKILKTLKYKIFNWINSLESCPNGASNLSDDAGLEDMVNLANSQLQQEPQHSEKLERRNQQEKIEHISPRPSPENVAHDNFLLPINVKRFATFEPY